MCHEGGEAAVERCVQLMRELEKVVRPNVVHFNVISPTTTFGIHTTVDHTRLYSISLSDCTRVK